MQLMFDFDKTLQACAILLEKAGGRLPRLSLLKLLYIADREFLFEKGITITGDTMYAMNRGPVLSTTYNLLKGNDSQSLLWENYICSCQDKEKTVKLVQSPGTLALSRSEVKTLNQVFENYGALSRFELVKLTHGFPEWTLYVRENFSVPVDPVQILKANNHVDCIPAYLEQIALTKEQRAIFI